MPNAATLCVTSPRGARLEVIADVPDGDGPLPALVVAPGQRYHMRLPVLAHIARAGVEAGVAVFRFAWALDATGRTSAVSADLEIETQDMAVVLSCASHHHKVNATRVFAGGKSVGSVVAWQLFRRRLHDRGDPALRGAVLVTPLIAAGAEGAIHYPGLQGGDSRVLLVAGDRDPHCDIATVRQLHACAPGPIALEILPGNHELVDDSRGPAVTGEQSAAAAAVAVARFIAAMSCEDA